jgi:hypothetical protein
MTSGVVPQKYPIGNDNTLYPALTNTCAPKHWDPTMIYRYLVPNIVATLPTDPRPWTKVCLEYVNSGPASPAPPTPENLVIPGAGEFYPPGRYAAAIDEESKLRRLDRALNEDLLPAGSRDSGCFPNQYTMPPRSDALQQQTLLPPFAPSPSKMVHELEAPAVLQSPGQYTCSEEAMACDLRANGRFWNNHSRLEKYNQRQAPCADKWQYVNGKPPSASNLPKVYQ